jgi:hypothetical protein
MWLGYVSTVTCGGWSSMRCSRWSSVRCSRWSIMGCNGCVINTFAMRIGRCFTMGCSGCVFKTFTMRYGEWFIVGCSERSFKRLLYVNCSPWTWLTVHRGMRWTLKLLDCNKSLCNKMLYKRGLECSSSANKTWPTKSKRSSYPTFTQSGILVECESTYFCLFPPILCTFHSDGGEQVFWIQEF